MGSYVDTREVSLVFPLDEEHQVTELLRNHLDSNEYSLEEAFLECFMTGGYGSVPDVQVDKTKHYKSLDLEETDAREEEMNFRELATLLKNVRGLYLLVEEWTGDSATLYGVNDGKAYYATGVREYVETDRWELE